MALRRRKKLSKELRKKFKGKCHWCGRAILRRAPQNHPLRGTIDHVTPRSKGGKDSRSNIVLACFQCNQAKGNIASEEFIRLTINPEE